MKDASRAARKFFRQGKLVAIANVRITMPSASTPTAGNAVYVSAMQNNWCTSNAWHKAFSVWDKQQREAIADSESQSAMSRFRDFKVFIDYQHEIVGNLEPVNLGPFSIAGPFPTAVVTAPALQSGEWDYSQIVVPDPASGVASEYSLHMHGPTTPSSKGIVAGYQSSRSYPQSPDPVGPAASSANNWMSAMFDDGSANPEILDNAENENDDLPYTQVNYPGGATQLPGLEFSDIASVYSTSATTNIGVAHLKGGNYPCGLMAVLIENHGSAPANIVIQVDLIPGEHRGYLAEPMQEM